MYKCENCGEEFEDPNNVEDFSSEYFGRMVTHYTNVCPCCGSDDFQEMDKCEICEEYIPAGEVICENCKELVDGFVSEIRGKAREKSIIHRLNFDELITQIAEGL